MRAEQTQELLRQDEEVPHRVGFPSSMLSNTVPISDNPDVVKILKQLDVQMNSSFY